MIGRGCSECGRELCGIKKSFTTEELVERFKEIHGDTYDYSKVKYINYLQNVIIICKKHGEFLQKPCNHIQGRNCRKCADETAGAKITVTTEEALLRIKEIYGDTYIYNKFIYNGSKGSYTLICKKHGDFKVIGNNTGFYGIVCPKCKRSFGECQIGNWLDCNNINYIEQFSHNSCKFKHKLRFDFMLPDFKTIIEYDGPQHFNPITYFHGKEAYDELVVKDQIKNQWAKDNGYKLLRISCINKKYITKILKNYVENKVVKSGGEAQ